MTARSVAHFPSNTRDPYLNLLNQALAAGGCRLDPSPRLSLFWLLFHRRRVLHFHWPSTHYETSRRGPIRWGPVRAVALALFLFKLWFARLLGHKLVWTAHNLRPHGPHHGLYGVERYLTCKYLWHGVIVHCPKVAQEVREQLGFGGPVEVIPHGHFIGYYPNTTNRAAARRDLGLTGNRFVYLHFGAIRPYKGLEILLASMDVPSWNNAYLLVAGNGDREYIHALQERAAGRPVRWDVGYVPDEAVQTYLHAADAVVLPYANVTTSGNLVLAMGFGKPVIVPAVGCIPDMVNDAFAVTYNPDGRVEALSDAMERVRGIDPEKAARMALGKAGEWGWEGIAGRTAAFYETVSA